MKKYINADKLISLIDTKLEDLGLSGSVWVGRSVLQDLKNDIITSLQQVQPKVDLEKEIDEKWDEFVSSEGEREDFTNIARHFYELGLNARKE